MYFCLKNVDVCVCVGGSDIKTDFEVFFFFKY